MRLVEDHQCEIGKCGCAANKVLLDHLWCRHYHLCYLPQWLALRWCDRSGE